MPRKFLMTWEGDPHYRWSKMYKGTRYRITCEDLKAPRTCEGSYQSANEWWRCKYAELLGPSTEEVETEAARRNWEVAWETLGKADPATKGIFEKLFSPEVVAPEASVSSAIDEFLAVQRRRGKKAKTYKEVADMLAVVRNWWGSFPAKSINEAKVTAAWTAVAGMSVGENSKKKRWNIVKRFVVYLSQTGRCELPRNLHMEELTFTVTTQQVQTWPVETVREELEKLPERFRLYALLGLNCGMTNIDIAELCKDMVVDGVLTRRRVKTGEKANVPTVSYRLWPETLALMDKFKSEHPALWFTARGREGVLGAKLVDHRIDEDGKPRTKDLIYLNWRRQVKNARIPLFKFRSVSASMLDNHGEYGRYTPHFLAHSPKSIMDKHYKAPSNEQFFRALDWLRGQYFGE